MKLWRSKIGKLTLIAMLALAMAASYWFGNQRGMAQGGGMDMAMPAAGMMKERKPLYYRNPMGLADTSPTPKKDSMGMDYIPVYADNDAGNDMMKAPKPLYYRNPMGLADTSPTPKKDSMGMDYIPVYADGDAAMSEASGSAPLVKISTEKVQKLGVKTETAEFRQLDRKVRASGRIEADETRLYSISPKFEGYVDRLYANITGQTVSKGQPLFAVYSPELVSAQREYAIAMQGAQALQAADSAAQASMRQLADSSLKRLQNWDIPASEINTLVQSGNGRHTLIMRSPVNGIITAKKVVQGMRFMPGESLYSIADLSTVWAIADVYENDLGLLKLGVKARVSIDAYPDRVFSGPVSYIYPTLQSNTRTAQVRIELKNRGLLKPGMYAQVDIPVVSQEKLLSVPLSALIDSGNKQIVLVQRKAGRFESREVVTGKRNDEYVEIMHGISAGERVVVAANFLIDAESNLTAVINNLGAADAAGGAAAMPHAHHH